jgi:hypothetical protein
MLSEKEQTFLLVLDVSNGFVHVSKCTNPRRTCLVMDNERPILTILLIQEKGDLITRLFTYEICTQKRLAFLTCRAAQIKIL